MMDLEQALEIADENLEHGFCKMVDLALHRLAEEVRQAERRNDLIRMGTVGYIRNGGNPGMAWYVRPALDAPNPLEGDTVYIRKDQP